MASTGRPSTGTFRRLTGSVADWLSRPAPILAGRDHATGDRQLSAFFSQVPVGLGELSLDGRLCLVNERFADLVGRTIDVLCGLILRDVVHEQDRHTYDRAFGHLAALNAPRVEEVRFVTAAGREVWVQIAISLLRDRRNRACGAAAVVFDIRDRKLAEARAIESEQRFRDVADAAPVYIWISGTDRTRRHTWVNTPWAEFRGRPMEDELGGGWMEGVHSEDRARCVRAYASGFDRKGPFSVEYRLKRWDGEYRWVFDSGAPIHDERGAFIGYIGSCVDITDRKTAEAEREASLTAERTARAEAERVNRLKDEFLSTLSHELRTPLNAVLGWVHLLKSSPAANGELSRGLNVIERNARLQSRMVDDLLDLRRIIAGKMQLDLSPITVTQAIDAAVESLQPAFAAKGVRVRKIYDPRVGMAMADAHRLQQIVWNLLSNAIKFSPPGNEVAVELRRLTHHVKIIVRDHGQGIDPQFLPYVFERFRQGDASTRRQHGGLGIGLALVKSLIELHGGTVRAASAGEGQGSTFTLMLPLSPSASADPTDDEESVACALNGSTEKKAEQLPYDT